MKCSIIIAAIAILSVSALAEKPKSGSWQVGNDSFHIYYDDIDVKSTMGRAQLLARVNKAVDRLCADEMNRQLCAEETVASISNPHIRQALADRTAVMLAAR